MAQGNPLPDVSAPSANLDDIHNRMYRLKELLRAADQIASNVLTDKESGPLYAIMQVSLMEAEKLDGLVYELWESPSLALKV